MFSFAVFVVRFCIDNQRKQPTRIRRERASPSSWMPPLGNEHSISAINWRAFLPKSQATISNNSQNGCSRRTNLFLLSVFDVGCLLNFFIFLSPPLRAFIYWLANAINCLRAYAPPLGGVQYNKIVVRVSFVGNGIDRGRLCAH